MKGWIRLHRSIMTHWIFKNPNYFRAWCIMLLTVNYEKTTVLVNSQLVECDRGQSLLSLHSWVQEFGVSQWSIQKVRTFFELLKKDKMITTECISKTTRLTICNYDSYQGVQQGHNTEITTNNNINKEKEKKEREIIEILGSPFLEPVNLWLKYKAEKKQNYKETGFITFLKKLGKMSNGNPTLAMEIIEHSMANNYSGLFPPKGKQNLQTANQSYR